MAGDHISTEEYLGLTVGGWLIEDRVMSIEEAEKTYPRKYSAAILTELGHTCACNFIYNDTRRSDKDKSITADLRLAEELRTLDYSPVMDAFFVRGLDRVSYEHEHDSFLFMFKSPPSALKFSRRDHSWHTIDPAGVNIRKRVEKHPERMATTKFCNKCEGTFLDPPYNPPLDYCPNCGAPASLFVSARNAVPQTIPASPGPPAPVPSSRLNGSYYLVKRLTAKCPICWSTFEVTQSLINRISQCVEKKTRSGCASGCLVNTRDLSARLTDAVPTGIIP